MADAIGTADVMFNGKMVEDVDIYAYHDPETKINYRTVFISDLGISPEEGPKSVIVDYRGNRYTAVKYGNPNNQVPSYDFKVSNKV